jgi:hypothetical protein
MEGQGKSGKHRPMVLIQGQWDPMISYDIQKVQKLMNVDDDFPGVESCSAEGS